MVCLNTLIISFNEGSVFCPFSGGIYFKGGLGRAYFTRSIWRRFGREW
jgi:hypothetical protein